jgi:hypothetical protein
VSCLTRRTARAINTTAAVLSTDAVTSRLVLEWLLSIRSGALAVRQSLLV